MSATADTRAKREVTASIRRTDRATAHLVRFTPRSMTTGELARIVQMDTRQQEQFYLDYLEGRIAASRQVPR